MTTAAELGFREPTGEDFVNTGDNDITHNAQRSAVMYDALRTFTTQEAGLAFDEAVADAESKYGSSLRTRGSLPLGDLFALKNYPDNGIYSMNASMDYPNAPFAGSGVLLVINDYQSPGMLMAQRDNTGELWITKTNTATGTFVSWNMVETPRGTQLTTEHLDTVIRPGSYWVRTSAEATTALGYPFNVYGSVRVISQHATDANITQIYYPSQRYADGFAMRSRHNTVWGVWEYFRKSSSVVAEAVQAARAAIPASSGFKVTPLALTLGIGAQEGYTTRHYRLPLNFAAPVPRFRVHIRNWNPRFGTARTGAVTFTGLWLGKHAGGGAFTAAPEQLRGGFATPEDGSDWVSSWFHSPTGKLDDYLLSFGYTAPAAPQGLVGGGWNTADPADASAVAPALLANVWAPFDIWLEAETPATTAVVAVLGDSLSSGVGATLPVHDSTLSQKMREVGGLPYHIASSGESMFGALTINPSKVTRWAGLAKPDAVLWAIGSNDIADGATLATLQQRFTDLLPAIQTLSSTVYLANIMPRTAWVAGGPEETTRRLYNQWLDSARPGAARDYFNFAASVSADDENILPQYDSADGTHLNTAGYAANSAAIVRPMSHPWALPA